MFIFKIERVSEFVKECNTKPTAVILFDSVLDADEQMKSFENFKQELLKQIKLIKKHHRVWFLTIEENSMRLVDLSAKTRDALTDDFLSLSIVKKPSNEISRTMTLRGLDMALSILNSASNAQPNVITTFIGSYFLKIVFKYLI